MKLKKRALCSKFELAQNEMDKSVPPNFKKADVDRTQCDLCGVKFLESPRNYFTKTEEFETDTAEADVPNNTDPRENNETALECNVSYFDHIGIEDHKNKLIAYHRYLDFFKLKVDPILQEGKDVMQAIEHTAEDHCASKEHAHVVQKKIQNNSKRIADTVTDVYKKKAWADAEKLMLADVNNLATNIAEAREWMSKKVEHKTKNEGFAQEHDYDHDVEVLYTGFEELCNKKAKRQKRRKMRK